jgi:alpha-tubulin suppressor-like RCC1 family protein
LFLSWHQSNKTPRLVRALRGTKLTSLAAGHTCSGVVDDAGCAYTMGYGRFWQLGLGHDRDQPTPEQVPCEDSRARQQWPFTTTLPVHICLTRKSDSTSNVFLIAQ